MEATIAKAVKTVGVVLGAAALIATGVGAVGGLGLVAAATATKIGAIAGFASGVLGMGAQALSPSMKPPPARGSVSQLIIDPNAPQPYAMGEGYYAGVLRHRTSYGGTIDKIPNPFLFDAVVYSGGGPVQSIAPRVDYGAIPGWYNTFLYTDVQRGLCPEPDALVPNWPGAPGWSAASKLSGQAAIGWSFRFDKDGKKFASGLPATAAEGRWVLAYDPRKDSTRPGGSGSHRLGNEATYEWTSNPALHAGTYAYGRYQNGQRTIGMGLPGDAIDWDVVSAWASTCDTNNWRMFGVVYEPGDRWQNLIDICAAGGAEPIPGAILSFRYQAPRVPLDTIRERDIADQEGSVCPMQSYRDRINTVIPRRVFPELNWELLPDGAVAVPEYIELDGEERRLEWPFNFVRDAKQAAQLAAYKLVDGREIHPIELVCNPRLRGYRPGDCLHLDLPQMGLDHDAIILYREFDPATMTVRFVLMSETPSKHAYALGEPGAVPPSPALVMTAQERDETAWENIPAEGGATVGAPNGTPVGDRPAEQVVSEIDAHAAALAQLDIDMQAFEQFEQQAQQQITDLLGDMSAAEAAILGAQGDISTLQSSVSTLGSTVNTQATAISNLEGNYASLSSTVAAQGASITSNATAIGTLQGDYASLTSTVGALQSSVSTNATAIATLDANYASLSTTVTAVTNSASINPNPTFADLTDVPLSLPSGWAFWSSTPTNSYRTFFDGRAWVIHAAENQNTGFMVGPLKITPGYYVLETDFQLLDGFYSGSGIYLDARNSSNAEIGAQSFLLTSLKDPDGRTVVDPNLSAFRPMRTTQLVHFANMATDSVYIVAMANWIGFGQGLPYKQVGFRRLALRPASDQERRAGIALPALEASVATNSSAIATLDSQYASLNSTVTAQGVTITNHSSALSTQAGNITTLFGRAGVRVDVNGRVTGWETNNNGQTGNFIIHADHFAIEKPGGGARTEFSNGNWRVYDAAGVLRVQLGVW